MRLIIAGGRDYGEVFDHELVMRTEFYLYKNYYDEDLIIIHGDAEGADSLADKISRDILPNAEKRIVRYPYPSELGKSGGPIRNAIMAAAGDELLAFWDGQSRGTKNMIDQMIKARKPYKVVFY